MNKSQSQELLKGAVIIALGGLISKLIGALYRIPLTNIIGSTGIGLYQLVFPVYTLILTITSAGITQGVSKLVAAQISRGDALGAKNILKRALMLFSALGFLGALALAVLTGPLSSLQGAPQAKLAYLFIAPSVFFVAIIACVRGFFQGQSNMRPTASSQILEQLVKAIFGLGLAYRFKNDVAKAAALTCFSVTLSELAALIYLLIKLKFNLKHSLKQAAETTQNIGYKKIFAITLPIAFSAVLIPVTQIIDSFFIVNVLSKHSKDAISLFGLYSGGVMTITGFPVAICYGIAAALIPDVSKHYALLQVNQAKRKIMLSIKYTLYIAVPCALVFLIFPSQINGIIFYNLPKQSIAKMSQIMQVASFSVVFLALTQTLAAALIATGRQIVPAIAMLFGVAVKVALQYFLLKKPSISISGAAISCTACYFVASVINLVYIIDKKDFVLLLKDFSIFATLALLCLLFVWLLWARFLIVGFVIGGLLAAAIYIFVTVKLKLIDLSFITAKRSGDKSNDIPSRIRRKKSAVERKSP